MDVTGVHWVAEGGATPDAAATYSFADDRLRIPLADPAVTGESRSVQIAYRGTPETGLKIAATKHGDRSFFSDNWPIKARHWLPTMPPKHQILCRPCMNLTVIPCCGITEPELMAVILAAIMVSDL